MPRRLVRSIKRPLRTGLLGPGIRTFHALHLARCRTDPRPAAAGGLDRGAGPGRPLADPADAALPQPARRRCDRAGLRPGIPGRNLARSAAGVLARRHRLPRCRQHHVRRLSAGASLRRRHLLDLLSTGPRDRRRAAGGARGTALADGGGVQFARRRVRPAGAGAPAMGAAVAAFLAIDRPEPAQRVVRLVDRGRAVAADDVGRARIAAAARRICRCHRARTARADVARSALCAARDRRPGVALSDLAAPRRRTRDAAMARDLRSRRARPAMGLAARRPGARDVRHRAAGDPQFRLVRPRCRGSADHLPAAGRSAGARLRLFLRHRAGAARKFPGRAVQFRPRRGRRRRCAC